MEERPPRERIEEAVVWPTLAPAAASSAAASPKTVPTRPIMPGTSR